jgi:hypothetical protein
MFHSSATLPLRPFTCQQARLSTARQHAVRTFLATASSPGPESFARDSTNLRGRCTRSRDSRGWQLVEAEKSAEVALSRPSHVALSQRSAGWVAGAEALAAGAAARSLIQRGIRASVGRSSFKAPNPKVSVGRPFELMQHALVEAYDARTPNVQAFVSTNPKSVGLVQSPLRQHRVVVQPAVVGTSECSARGQLAVRAPYAPAPEFGSAAQGLSMVPTRGSRVRFDFVTIPFGEVRTSSDPVLRRSAFARFQPARFDTCQYRSARSIARIRSAQDNTVRPRSGPFGFRTGSIVLTHTHTWRCDHSLQARFHSIGL